MFRNHVEDWRAFTERYRAMGDEELAELARAFNDLTSTAQQVLRDELRLRKLGDPLARPVQGTATQTQAALHPSMGRIDSSFGPSVPRMVFDVAGARGESAGSVEYTWKTLLCHCRDQRHAWQITEVLRRTGIESWIEDPRSYMTSRAMQEVVVDDGSIRILVAADQLEAARAVSQAPIPTDIVEASELDDVPYEPPVCPRCGLDDPILESAEPVNRWKCESCGTEWSDPEAEEDGKSSDAASI